MKKENIILKLTLEFSLLIIEYCEILEENKRFVIANQLLKSGTSIDSTKPFTKEQKKKIELAISSQKNMLHHKHQPY